MRREVMIATGLYRGKWIAYRQRRDLPQDSRLEATCLRCRADTREPGGTGWFYRRGELRGYTSAQICPACLTVLRLGEPGA
jgi:hypothetical protein